MECCRDSRFGRFFHIHTGLLVLTGNYPDLSPSPYVLSLAEWVAQRIVSGLTFFHLRMMEATIFFTAIKAIDFWGSLPRGCF